MGAPFFKTEAGFYLHVSQYLAGSKKAIKQGSNIFLSPAMYDLIQHASGKELTHILKNIPIIEIPEVDFASLKFDFQPPPDCQLGPVATQEPISARSADEFKTRKFSTSDTPPPPPVSP